MMCITGLEYSFCVATLTSMPESGRTMRPDTLGWALERSGLGFFLRGEAAGCLGDPPGTLGAMRGEGFGDFSLEIVGEGGGMELEPMKPSELPLDNLGLWGALRPLPPEGLGVLGALLGLLSLSGGEWEGARGVGVPENESRGGGSKDIGGIGRRLLNDGAGGEG